MTVMFTPTAWRLPHWVIAIGSGLLLAMYAGVIQPREIAAYFASRPEVAQAFADPHFGRADALILVFSTLFLAPFAVFVASVLLVFGIAMLGGFVLPVVRWFRMPDWIATAFVLFVGAYVAWANSDQWLPRSLWFLGRVARAWKIIVA